MRVFLFRRGGGRGSGGSWRLPVVELARINYAATENITSKMMGGYKSSRGGGCVFVCVCASGSVFFPGLWAETGIFSYRPQWRVLAHEAPSDK